MDFTEMEGDTIDQAIENALKLFGVERERITVEILSEGRKGILGFGAQKARIRASLRGSAFGLKDSNIKVRIDEPQVSEAETAAVAAKAKVVLAEILRLMGMEAVIETKVGGKGEETVLAIRAQNNGLLIGRKGQTLEALQYLLTRIVEERSGSDGPHVVLDVENYRERRRRSLEDMALRLGEKAKRQRKTVTVDALSAADRRIVHAVLQDDPWVTTKSLGQGPYRRLLIIPEGDRKKKEEPKAPGQEKRGTRDSK